MSLDISISKPAAPEDIRPGSYVAVLHIVGEHLPLFCADDVDWRKIAPLRVLWLPCGSSEPLKVKDVCLPFVFVKTPRGDLRTIDVRRYRLALLNDRYGRKVYKRLRQNYANGDKSAGMKTSTTPCR